MKSRAARKWLTCSLVAAAMVAVSGVLAAEEASNTLPPVSAAAREHISQLLDVGFQPGTKNCQAAEKHLVEARRLLPGDPRLEFAWGLVLQKQLQYKAALAQFEKAAGSSSDAYWPAWQALILLDHSGRKYDSGFQRLDEFAALVQESRGVAVDAEQRLAAARWLGQLLGALDKTVDPAAPRAAAVKSEAAMRERWSPDIMDAFDEGWALAENQHASLQAQIDATQHASNLKQERKKAGVAARLNQRKQDLEQQKVQTNESLEQLKKSFTDDLAKCDKALGRLERDYELLESHAKSLFQSIDLASREIESLRHQGPDSFGNDPRLGRQLPEAQMQLKSYKDEMYQVKLQMAVLIQRAKGMLEQRSVLTAGYDRATGQFIAKDASLRKWANRVDLKKKQLAKQPVNTATPIQTLANRLASYLILDLESERTRLAKSFGVAVQLADDH